jgi:3-isopropylmalate dehydrogenase
MDFKITLLPGDGIGPEVVAEAVRVLDVIAGKYNHTIKFTERLMGGCSIDKYGSSLTDETLADCKSSDAVLLGAVGGPKWMTPWPKIAPNVACSHCARDLACSPIFDPSKCILR